MDNPRDIIEVIFKLRAEAYSIWTLTFVMTSATVGWLLGKDLIMTNASALLQLFFVLFVGMVSVAFGKTYDELHSAVLDLERVLLKRDLPQSDLVSYWHNHDYHTHAYYAYALNSVFLGLVVALVWGPASKTGNSHTRYRGSK